MGKLFDEFAVGQRFVTPRRPITEADIVAFSGLAQSLDPLPITLNLQRSARIVGAFAQSSFLEDRTYRRHVGRSSKRD